MWVFCAGMFRSGSTLQYQIASHLVEHHGRGSRVTWHDADDFGAVRATFPDDDRLRVFKAHRLSPAIRAELEHRGGHVITVHRDIRDVVASALRKNGWSLRHVLKHRLLERWTGRFEAWAALPGALVSRYDRLAGRIDDEAVRIGRHLGLDVPPALAAQVAAEYDVARQRERTAAVRAGHGGATPAPKYDGHSLLHHNHIAGGTVGGYRTLLRPAEIRAVERACGPWMQRWGYAPDAPRLGPLDRVHGLLLRWAA